MNHTTATTISKEQAVAAIAEWKGRLPFRNWCAIELNGSWLVCDSIRRAKAAWKLAGYPKTEMLTSGKD